VDAWTFVWLMLVLKIPIAALFLIVRWAVRQTPEPAGGQGGQDGGIGTRARAVRPHPRRPLPRLPRRGPHGARIPAPARVRTGAIARSAGPSRRLPQR
jgi:hypothetical protein